MSVYNKIDDLAASVVDLFNCGYCLKAIFSKEITKEEKLEYRKSLKKTLKGNKLVKSIKVMGIPVGTLAIGAVSKTVGAYEMTSYLVNDSKYKIQRFMYSKQGNYTMEKNACDNIKRNDEYIKKAVPITCAMANIMDTGLCALELKLADQRAVKDIGYKQTKEYKDIKNEFSESKDNFFNNLSQEKFELFSSLVKSTKSLLKNIKRQDKDDIEEFTESSTGSSGGSDRVQVSIDALSQMVNDIREFMVSEDEIFSRLASAFFNTNEHWNDKHSERFEEVLLTIRKSIALSMNTCTEALKDLQKKIDKLEQYEKQ